MAAKIIGYGCHPAPSGQMPCVASPTCWPTPSAIMRILPMTNATEPRSLTSLGEKLIKIGAKVVRGRGVATDVHRHPVTDVTAAGTAPGMRGSCEQVLHATRGEVCAGKASRYSVPVPPTARSERLLLAPGAICGCPYGQRVRFWL
jgi:hypothetical protein